ncbi:MAG: AMP-binding protein [Burkholderiaceae bacterium]|nr:AMP-binding protein [Burkholderiaceae bacterium]
MAMSTAPFLPLPFLPRDLAVEVRRDGAILMRSRVPLGPVEPHLPAMLLRQARVRAAQPWLMQRRGDGAAWRALSYGEAAEQAQAAAQWLLAQDRPGRAVMVLSGNSLEHAVFELAAMKARMPYVPVTPAYSLLSADHAKLRAMVELIDPAVVFVQEAARFERALRALGLRDVRVIHVEAPVAGLASTPWSEVTATPVGEAVQASIAAIEPGTVAKVLFTSGSTGVPKAVPVTQHMLCATTAMHAQTVQRDADTPPSVLLEWLPWSHVAGGTAIFDSVLEDGGTMYLDDGRPVPGEFEKTLRNLEEVSPTRFSSVPAGYAMLADALERSESLGHHFFRRLRRLTSSGAKLPDSLYQRLQAQAVRHLGHRVPFVAGYGSTETCAATTVIHWPTELPGLVGLPQPGVELKLVPLDDQRYEVRVRGPSVMSGYLAQPELTRQAFDDEGYYGMGDAVTFVDRARPEEGLAFAGRVAEEFKLQSGIFVRVGSLRVELVGALAPWITDVVVTGADRAWVGLLAWPNVAACRERFGALPLPELLRQPALHEALHQALQRHNADHSGSSRRIARMLLLAEPPSLDAGEITDKGYVNQRAVLARRAADVERLYAATVGPDVVVIDPAHTPSQRENA